MPLRRMTVINDKAADEAPAIDGRGEVHEDDMRMFNALSHTKFQEPGSLENLGPEPILDLTNLDGDWNA